MHASTSSRVVGAGADAQDRVGIFGSDRLVLLVLADGAGGQRGGAEAAERVVESAGAHFHRPGERVDPTLWGAWMRQLDLRLADESGVGESTAIVCVIEDGRFVGGCSVGDSEALLVTAGSVVDLTRDQRRKPLLGSGKVAPQPFFVRREGGTLLLGSDGLFKYAPRDKIVACIRSAPFAELLDQLVDLVRLPSGARSDDVGLVAFTA